MPGKRPFPPLRDGQRTGARRRALPGGRIGGSVSAVGRLSPQQVRPAVPGCRARRRRSSFSSCSPESWARLGDCSRADRARKAEANRAEGEKRANAQRKSCSFRSKREAKSWRRSSEDLDPRAEEKEGRPLRTILGDRLDRAAADLEGEAVGDPLVVAKLQDRLGRTYRALGHADKARSLFTKALAIRRAQLGARTTRTRSRSCLNRPWPSRTSES